MQTFEFFAWKSENIVSFPKSLLLYKNIHFGLQFLMITFDLKIIELFPELHQRKTNLEKRVQIDFSFKNFIIAKQLFDEYDCFIFYLKSSLMCR